MNLDRALPRWLDRSFLSRVSAREARRAVVVADGEVYNDSEVGFAARDELLRFELECACNGVMKHTTMAFESADIVTRPPQRELRASGVKPSNQIIERRVVAYRNRFGTKL